ncbi:HNH endonuclease signature motif containing protein [Paenibacillus xylanexedens]|uniref:HNH endonuclease signature motif containing protein n=1 Tax=Paenibacillus xylanexedens TaxID=528191 RepID=UPI000F53F4DE|nr:HNH endonuclease signature motif containing protein [Paenibacillus xylanexedens]
MTKEIILSTGEVCLVDDDDYDYLNQWKWYCDLGYALKMQNDGEKRINIRMHRLITDCPSGLEVDHINHNRLDNRKKNLRICTSKENSRNMRKIPNNGSSIYKGVSKREHIGLTTWRMKITADYCCEAVNLNFTNEIAAANAYNYYASKLFGEYACLNECPHYEKR